MGHGELQRIIVLISNDMVQLNQAQITSTPIASHLVTFNVGVKIYLDGFK